MKLQSDRMIVCKLPNGDRLMYGTKSGFFLNGKQIDMDLAFELALAGMGE